MWVFSPSCGPKRMWLKSSVCSCSCLHAKALVEGFGNSLFLLNWAMSHPKGWGKGEITERRRRTTWPSLEKNLIFNKFRVLVSHFKRKKNQVIKLRQHPHRKEPHAGGLQESEESLFLWEDCAVQATTDVLRVWWCHSHYTMFTVNLGLACSFACCLLTALPFWGWDVCKGNVTRWRGDINRHGGTAEVCS